jgi:hypothetical protein
MIFRYLLTLAFLAATFGAGVLPAAAQQVVPVYDHWQASWDAYQYDRRHVILGTVAAFEPFRLEVARRDGVVQMIDLKDGTVILPTGATPATNERVAVVGYYSKGTFIANRVILHG